MNGQPEALVDLSAIRSNVAGLIASVRGAQVMAVVKSDGYGHGLIPTALAAVAGGATWLGVNSIDEAVRLRQAGVAVPVLCMLAAPGAPHADGVSFDVDLS